jgi:hypothetical protein
LNKDELAEDITYAPPDESARHIKAIVIRERSDTGLEDTGRILQTQVELYILNDKDLGLIRVNKGEDKVRLPLEVDGEPIEWRVVDIISKDEALWRLVIQR